MQCLPLDLFSHRRYLCVSSIFLGSHYTSCLVLSFSCHHLGAALTQLLCEFLLSLVVRNLGMVRMPSQAEN